MQTKQLTEARACVYARDMENRATKEGPHQVFCAKRNKRKRSGDVTSPLRHQLEARMHELFKSKVGLATPQRATFVVT